MANAKVSFAKVSLTEAIIRPLVGKGGWNSVKVMTRTGLIAGAVKFGPSGWSWLGEQTKQLDTHRAEWKAREARLKEFKELNGGSSAGFSDAHKDYEAYEKQAKDKKETPKTFKEWVPKWTEGNLWNRIVKAITDLFTADGKSSTGGKVAGALALGFGGWWLGGADVSVASILLGGTTALLGALAGGAMGPSDESLAAMTKKDKDKSNKKTGNEKQKEKEDLGLNDRAKNRKELTRRLDDDSSKTEATPSSAPLRPKAKGQKTAENTLSA